MHQELVFAFSRVTESAAIAAYHWLGRGDKNLADGAAVVAMRTALSDIDMAGTIVIGEGEIDEAPMLYIGERLGKSPKGVAIDIAVDPIEGTRMTALGQSNAVAVLAAGKKGSLLGAPDMYMEKLVVGREARGVIDLDAEIEDNVSAVANAKGKAIGDLTIVTLAKPRHDAIIKRLHALGCKVFSFPDGDVAASILACVDHSEVDMMYCIGGAPEGVISAAAVSALGGDMQGRLLLRSDAKGNTLENQKSSKLERQRCEEMGVTPGAILQLSDLVKDQAVCCAITGITQGDLVEGIKRVDDELTTHTLLISGVDNTVRTIKTRHLLPRSK